MTAAELEIKIKADIDPSINSLDKLNKKATETNTSFKQLSPVLKATSDTLNATTKGADNVASSLTKMSTATSGVSKTIVNEFGTVVNSFDSIEKSIDDIANSFNQKWNPIIAGAEAAAAGLDEANTSAKSFQQTLSSFAAIAGLPVGGGVLKINDQGITAALQNINKLSVAVTNIPPINFKISTDTQAALVQFQTLGIEIKELSIGGSVSIGKLNAALATLRTASQNATDPASFARYEAAIEKLEAELIKLKTATGNASSPLGKFGKDSTTAGFAVQNLGRVLQDIPFGFVGIANNLNPLLESFQRLQAESKKTGSSLVKDLLGALKGPGGIGLALSAVSAALTLVTFGTSALTRGFGGAKDAVDDATKANEAYAKSLEDIQKSAVQNSQKQITDLQTLTLAAQNNALSFQGRIDAVNKLQEQFPGYFANLTKEQILYGDLTQVINKTTEAIINQALAQASVAKAVEAGVRIADLTEKQKKAQFEYNLELSKTNKAAYDISSSLPQIGRGTQAYVSNLGEAKIALGTITDQLNEARLEQANFIGQFEKYTGLTSGLTKTGDAFTQTNTILVKLGETIDDINRKQVLTGADLKTDKIQAYRKAIEDLAKIPIDTTQIKNLQAEINRLMNLGADKGSSAIKDLQAQIAKLDPAKTQIPALLQAINDLGGSFVDASKKANEISKILEKLKDDRAALAGDWKILDVDKPIKDAELLFDAIQKLINAKAPEAIIIKLQAQLDAESLNAVGLQLQKTFGSLQKFKIPDTALPDPIKIKVLVDTDALEFNQLKGKVEALAKRLGIEIPVNIDELNEDQLKRMLADFNRKIHNDDHFLLKIPVASVSTEVFDQLQDEATKLAEIFDQLLGPSFTAAFDALASGQNVISAVGQTLKQLVVGLAAAAAEAALLALLIGAITGKPVNFGNLFSQLSGLPHFDEGGITTQNMVGLLHSREAVIPLDRLHDFIPSSEESKGFIAETRISGQDLIILLKRGERLNGRTY